MRHVVVLISFLTLNLMSSGAWADCKQDAYGQVVCGAGDCIQDSYGHVKCSNVPHGSCMVDSYGRAVCEENAGWGYSN